MAALCLLCLREAELALTSVSPLLLIPPPLHLVPPPPPPPPSSSTPCSFQDFELQSSRRCVQDWLSIGSYKNLDGFRACGSPLPAPYISSQDHVWVKFHSDDSLTAKGFRLTYITGRRGGGGLEGWGVGWMGTTFGGLEGWRAGGLKGWRGWRAKGHGEHGSWYSWCPGPSH